MNIRRIIRLLKKELVQIFRDRRSIGLLVVAPVLQLFMFGYAVTTDINQISTAIYDEDRTAASRELIERFTSSGYFIPNYYLSSPREIDALLDGGKVQMVLHIPPGFARDLARGRGAEMQTILDGSDSMTARIIAGYATAVIQGYSGRVMAQRLDRLRGTVTRVPAIEGRLRVWYNPELRSARFMVPAVLSMILLTITIMLTSMSIVREKELGTLEQLVVTPLTPAELMLGKTLPGLLIGMLDMAFVLLVAIFWFHVNVAGSILLLFLLSILFLLTTLGLGIFISTISKTQHEATLTSFFFILPFIILSGFMFPIENMPRVIQYVTYIIPMRYFLEIIRGIFLRGVGLEYLWPQTLALAAFGVGILTLSAKRFSKRLG
ncbi:MAG: ABC transporter permease [Armatimonadota bacterium]